MTWNFSCKWRWKQAPPGEIIIRPSWTINWSRKYLQSETVLNHKLSWTTSYFKPETILNRKLSRTAGTIFLLSDTILKGDYEDYTLGYRQNPLDFAFPEFHFQLVPSIPHLAIGKTILERSRILIFFTVWKSNL